MAANSTADKNVYFKNCLEFASCFGEKANFYFSVKIGTDFSFSVNHRCLKNKPNNKPNKKSLSHQALFNFLYGFVMWSRYFYRKGVFPLSSTWPMKWLYIKSCQIICFGWKFRHKRLFYINLAWTNLSRWLRKKTYCYVKSNLES